MNEPRPAPAPRDLDHLVVSKLSKSFGALKANDDVTIHVRRGTVHAILGENGAGKTTLMNMLYGLLQPDSGEILLDGKPVRIDSPRHALELGIGMVHQHFMLVDPLTVTENVILGLEGQGHRLDLKSHERRLAALSDSFGFEIEPSQTVSRLPIGMQQRVEILKSLYRDADLLILDEPTSVLTPGEARSFFGVLRKLKEAGKTILFITHKLEEVMELSDRVTVMRGGRVTDEVETKDTNASELARLMVGRDVIFDLERPQGTAGHVLFDVRNVHAYGDRGNEALAGISFELRAGEILGFAGVDGNGQAELAETIAGLRSYHEGSMQLDGENIAPYSVRDRMHKLRIGYVPEDRHKTGLVLDQSVAANLMLRSYDRRPFVKHGYVLDRTAIRANAARLVDKFRVRTSSIEQHVRRLSGGNQQKVILAREIDANPKLLVVAQPCKGLDVGAIEFVQNTLIEQRNKGVGIIYISTELEHILAVCDRIAVMFKGRIMGILQPNEVTSERIGKMMAGITEAAA
ncbi:simple sugar transport system ATP-binding protein [Rhodoligotrophos appendicifer]|uniref:ABC transporter ATP-binding protein n=1 Tax=Rhodoligotrophos appendicifer TaxID=987056 RepID=UPI00117D0910|nr:ABC transporter ATP-binding protein [Rhodoligotrophos appendicifer]